VFDRFAVDSCITAPETVQALTEAGIVAPRRYVCVVCVCLDGCWWAHGRPGMCVSGGWDCANKSCMRVCLVGFLCSWCVRTGLFNGVRGVWSSYDSVC
jgi:hypothetical protein